MGVSVGFREFGRVELQLASLATRHHGSHRDHGGVQHHYRDAMCHGGESRDPLCRGDRE